jgi:hypothetical protein
VSLTPAPGQRWMNKLQATARIMLLLNEEGLLKPGSYAYRTVRKMISEKIDKWGPEAALVQVMDRKAHLLDQIKILCMWQKSATKLPPSLL